MKKNIKFKKSKKQIISFIFSIKKPFFYISNHCKESVRFSFYKMIDLLCFNFFRAELRDFK